MTVAVTIDDVINYAQQDLPIIAYDISYALSLFTQVGLWSTGMFSEASGIFPPSENEVANPGQRPVSNWMGTTLQALDSIEGPAVGDAALVGTSTSVNAVVRAASAVKYATINGYITAGNQTAVIALYNTCFGGLVP